MSDSCLPPLALEPVICLRFIYCRQANAYEQAYHELEKAQKHSIVKQRVSDYSKKVYRKAHETKIVEKESVVCQRENPFYVDTVRNFRDRRYEYKGLLKQWKIKLERQEEEADVEKVDEAKKMIVVYDSLQLAHKCILNSFYGYVMRKYVSYI